MECTEPQADSADFECSARLATAHLHVVYGRARHALHELPSHGATLGRESRSRRADLAFQDARMSRQHARIEQGPSSWYLVDQGSRNGAFVDGQPIGPGSRAALVDGSVIRLGDSLLVFRESLARVVGAGAPSGPSEEVDETVFPGESVRAAAIRRRIHLLAGGTGHVLILGETGTGKERAARAIGLAHASRPFVAQNCAELTRDLARSELFGHARGAYSGANANKLGLVDVAGDGALFLDEIGEMPLDVQGDLLRFLEDGSYRPLGSTELRHSRARVLAATNVDLDNAVRAGRFRQDLLARLRATNPPLELPPVRDRREDILGWAQRFLLEVLGDCPAEPWTAGAAECVLLYPWPENLRELRGAIRALAADHIVWPIAPRDLPDRIHSHRRAQRVGPERTSPQPLSQDPTRGEIVSALEETRGRMRPAAQKLGIDRRKLYRLCERHGIDLEYYRREHVEEDS